MATTTAERVRPTGRPLSVALLGDLAWRRPGVFSRTLVLEAGSERLASLRWEKWFSFEAVAESADGRWIIGRRRAASVLGDHVVRDLASGTEVAAFKRSWRGTGVARFASGPEYAWGREGFWHPRYSWAAADGRPLLTFRTELGFGRGGYTMDVDPSARPLAELPVLVLLGGYVMAMISAQRAAS
jgi:hypothetical protein